MPILRPLSILLRNTLIKQHPYFSCCSSCGEIKTPLGNRLCTSLQFAHSIDVVLACEDLCGEESTAIIKKRVSHIQKCFPWLGKIFIISQQVSMPFFCLHNDPFITCLKEADIVGNPNNNTEEYIHTIPNLSEYYLVVSPNAQLEKKAHPLDFYTPNGIPLVYGAKLHELHFDFQQVPIIKAYTKESVTNFIMSWVKPEADNSSEFYCTYVQWAYENGHVILAPS